MTNCTGFNCTCPPGQTNIPFGFCTTVLAAAIICLIIVIIAAICICICCMMETIRNACGLLGKANVFPTNRADQDPSVSIPPPVANEVPSPADDAMDDGDTGDPLTATEQIEDEVEETGLFEEQEEGKEADEELDEEAKEEETAVEEEEAETNEIPYDPPEEDPQDGDR